MSKAKRDLMPCTMARTAGKEGKVTKRINKARADSIAEQAKRNEERQHMEARPKKLRDYFTNEPQKHAEIKALCRDLNIKVSDQSDVSEIMERANLIKETSNFAIKLFE